MPLYLFYSHLGANFCIPMHTFTFYLFRYATCHIVNLSFFGGGGEGELILCVCTQDAYVFLGFYFFRNKFLKLQRTLKIGVLQFLELWKCITSISQEIWFSITLNIKNIKRNYCQPHPLFWTMSKRKTLFSDALSYAGNLHWEVSLFSVLSPLQGQGLLAHPGLGHYGHQFVDQVTGLTKPTK